MSSPAAGLAYLLMTGRPGVPRHQARGDAPGDGAGRRASGFGQARPGSDASREAGQGVRRCVRPGPHRTLAPPHLGGGARSGPCAVAGQYQQGKVPL
ncbi:hypothetical protein KNE206_68140 [Kitasatospora sp. NE20-6]